MLSLDVNGRNIGASSPCFIIAEAGVNHNGDLATARKMIDVATDAGADAIKFQTFKTDKLAVRHALQVEMLRKLELSDAAHHELQNYCKQRGMLFLSTPFDEDSADLLVSLGVPAFKVASGELTNLPLLRHMARKHIPMIISTGMASMGDVETAVKTVRGAQQPEFALLHCVSQYPAEPAEVNLRAMATLEQAFAVPIGFSDHTLGIEVSLAAVACGARIIEKHFTLDRGMSGPDHRASLEPDQLQALIRGVRTVEAALGDGCKQPVPCEIETARVARKSLVAAQDIAEGEIVREAAIACKRPGTGLPPMMCEYLVGRKARQCIAADTVLSLEMFA